jgi:hypothetical protein
MKKVQQKELEQEFIESGERGWSYNKILFSNYKDVFKTESRKLW